MMPRNITSQCHEARMVWGDQDLHNHTCQEEVAHEVEPGKIYRSNFVDKYSRSVLVMRPARQNTNSTKGQIEYLVYCMENAILDLPANQEQMVWLIDFHGFNMSHISVKDKRNSPCSTRSLPRKTWSCYFVQRS